MRKILLITMLLFLVSCWMTNEEIVEQTKICEDNGFIAVQSINWSSEVFRIRCEREDSWLNEIQRIQIQNCIDRWLQPRKSSWDSEYICE